MTEELANLDAVAQADLVRGGEVSPVELVEAAIARVEKLDDQLNAVIHRRFERARDDVASATLPDGPFRGVPMVLKDLDGYSLGDPCHEGNKLLKEIDWHGDHDSALVAKLRGAGFVFVGKSNAPEFGLMPTTEPLTYGPTRNPWNPDRSPGGSSGGSAAAVASGMVPVGHAGDGGGSIRIPSSACGLFGLKPTRGRVSFGPGEGESWAGLVVRHAVTRSVRDSAAVLDVIAGPMPGDPYTAPRPDRPFADEVGVDPGKLRIGVRVDAPGSLCETHPDCVAAVEDTAALLESLGHSVETASPVALDETDLMGMFLTIMTPWVVHDVATVQQRAGREVTADDFEPLTWAYTEIGRSYTADQYLEAVAGAHAWSRRVAIWWDSGFDLLLTPTMATPPTVLGDLVPPADNPLEGAVKATPVAAYSAPFNVTGQPAMSVPLFWNDDGLPIGTQLVASYGREDVLVRVASQLEAARDRGPTAGPRSAPDGTVSVRIAGGQGFYGDTPRAVEGLLGEGVDYLCLEALAELTLAILQKDRQRDETAGYTRDLPLYLAQALPAVAAGETKVITNAGGINPTAATRAAIATAKQLGISGVRIATVLGDDLLPHLGTLQSAGCELAHLDTGAPFEQFPGEPRFAAAYLGARPIVEALDQGADVVITGRVADAALFLAAAAHAHGWAWDDWDRLAGGTLVGHLLECSGQVAGGNYSGEWWTIPHPWDLPYPIADVGVDGDAVITKPAAAGGRVDFDTVRHQLLYEVHDPSAYLAPDVVADFTSARFTDLGADRVRVDGVRGAPATPTYKALLAYHAGWSGEARVAFSWPDAPEKARATAALLATRAGMAGLAVEEWCFEYWGMNALGGPTVPPARDEPPEVVLRAAWRCADERTAGLVGRELVPLSLSAPPAGFTGMGRAGGGRPTELLGIWPTLVDRALVDANVRVWIEEVD